MKLNWMFAALAAIALTFPVLAYADDTALVPVPKHHVTRHHSAASPAVASANPGEFNDKWAGTYSSREINFVTVKRLTFSKDKDGSLKIRGALVGFPEEVSIGDAAAEPYADRNSKNSPDMMLASFASEKFKPLMVITPAAYDGPHVKIINFTCYMTDVDGSKVHINGALYREP